MTARFPFLAALIYCALLALAVVALTGCGGGDDDDEHDVSSLPPSCATGVCR